MASWFSKFLIAAFVAAFSLPASAREIVCPPTETLIAGLVGKYAEQPVALGMAENGTALVHLFKSKDGATWTVIVSYPNGHSCMIAAGEDWREYEAEPEGQGL